MQLSRFISTATIFLSLGFIAGCGTPTQRDMMREAANTDSIRRLDGRRTVTLNIVPPREVALETGVATVTRDLLEAMAADGELPLGARLA